MERFFASKLHIILETNFLASSSLFLEYLESTCSQFLQKKCLQLHLNIEREIGGYFQKNSLNLNFLPHSFPNGWLVIACSLILLLHNSGWTQPLSPILLLPSTIYCTLQIVWHWTSDLVITLYLWSAIKFEMELRTPFCFRMGFHPPYGGWRWNDPWLIFL